MASVWSVLAVSLFVAISGCLGGDTEDDDEGPAGSTLPALVDYTTCDFRTSANVSIECDNLLSPIVVGDGVPNGWLCLEEVASEGVTMALYRHPVQRETGIRFEFMPADANLYVGWVRAVGPDATITNRIVSPTGSGFGAIPGMQLLPDQSATVVVRIFDLNYTSNHSALAAATPDPILHVVDTNDTLAPASLLIHRLRLDNITTFFTNYDSTPFNVTGLDFQLAVNVGASDFRSEGKTMADGLPPDPNGAC